MSEHTPTWTPTPWVKGKWDCTESMGGGRVSLDGFALNTGPHDPEASANRDRIVACVNAFHVEGREIKTERITEGLVWEMRDVLAQLILDYQDVPDATDADSQALFADARALLAKLED